MKEPGENDHSSGAAPCGPALNHKVTVVLLLVLVIYAFVGQNLRGLWQPDEGRYTCVALNMLENGDWLNPRLNDEKLHFTKPPLTYWAIASSIGLFGRHEWAARVPNSLAFIGTVLLVAVLGLRFCPRRPLLPALIYATLPLPYMASNVVTTDTLLTLWETLAMVGFVEWRLAKGLNNRAWWLILMWAGFALAFMTKGPPGLLPLGAMMIFAWFQRRWRGIGEMLSFPGLAVFALIGLTWYVVVIFTHKNLLGYFFGDEIYGRIVSGEHHRNAQWYGGFVVYLPTLLLGTLPWSLFFARRLCRAGAIRGPKPYPASREMDPEQKLLLLWFLLPLGVLFVARSRLPLYLLPLFVPLSILLARPFAETGFEIRHQRWLLAGWIAFLASTRVIGCWIDTDHNTQAFAMALQRQIKTIPHEIVFVDSEPFLGLKFYLDTEVERVNFKPNHGEETIKQEIATTNTASLFIVQRRDEDHFMRVTPPKGDQWRQVGGYKDSLFFEPQEKKASGS